MCLNEGIVLVADTRTNAGVDNIATFGKLHMFEKPGERVIGLMTAGNLAVAQSVVSLVREGLENKETGQLETLFTTPSMFEAARLVGRAVRDVHARDAEALAERGIAFDVSFIIAGQLHGRRMRMFQVYAAGNFIESSADTPFMQIGEHKYGKPILDRVCKYDTPLWDAVKLAMISMDSTLRSNLSVGPPIDVAVIRRDEVMIALQHRVTEDDPYFRSIRDMWSSALREAYRNMPPPPWADGHVESEFERALKAKR
jgi:putative proteasome-type protease